LPMACNLDPVGERATERFPTFPCGFWRVSNRAKQCYRGRGRIRTESQTANPEHPDSNTCVGNAALQTRSPSHNFTQARYLPPKSITRPPFGRTSWQCAPILTIPPLQWLPTYVVRILLHTSRSELPCHLNTNLCRACSLPFR
jgi:hypothetical protein